MNLQYFLNFIKQTKLLIFILVGLVIGVLIIPLFLPQKPETPLSSPIPSPKIQYPFAQQQIFPNIQPAQKVSASITTTPPGAEVTIDKEILNSQNVIAPINISPFTIQDIPEGKHSIRVFRLGYLVKTQEIEVQKGKDNTFSVVLEKSPVEDRIQNIIAKMPVSTADYYIEYLDAIKKIQVLVRKAPYEINKQKAVDWFNQNGISDPETSGIEFYPALNVK